MSFDAFIEKWKKTGASERANFQPFMLELMNLLNVEPVLGSTSTQKADDYAFERPVINRISNTTKFIDFYRKGSFVMEGKQGSDKLTKPEDTLQYELSTGEYYPRDQRVGTARRGTAAWLTEMIKARQQAENYARNLESDQGLPPFIIVVDVGYIIELYADFSGQGKYEQFPSKKEHQIYMDDLRREDIQALLQAIWNAPQSLDPSQKAAKVTREVAIELAELGKSYPVEDYDPEAVAKFLMRCLFTMFAEDVELIPRLSFESLLKEARDSGNVKSVAPLLEELWTKMDQGGFSTAIREDIKRFNGGLFRAEKGGSIRSLPVNKVQLSLLIRAAEKDWKRVEPSIFGTLLERALSPKARHKLGAHYTPRPYVERLVGPTIMEPLRSDFDAAKAAAVALLEKQDLKAARQVIKDFHHTLCTIRVLDPACGSGNFLYVAMENMKRLEADVLKLLEDLGENEPRLMLQGETVDPHQFLGLEVNEWAVWAAELVLWIGYLQWHFKTFGNAAPSEPVLKNFHNIEKRDALLKLDGKTLHVDETGKPFTKWDGETYKMSPVTGERVPDPDAQISVHTFNKASAAEWPDAHFIIGNPPFIGRRNIRKSQTDSYLEALGEFYPKVPANSDYVMYWWYKAAEILRVKSRRKIRLRRFGFITTNSITQSFNRKLVSKYTAGEKSPLSIIFAIPDHPWVDSSDGAAVRIAMTVLAPETKSGRALKVAREFKTENENIGYDIQFSEKAGLIHPDLSIGPNLVGARKLKANSGLCSVGYQLTGKGFILSRNRKNALLDSEPKAAVHIGKLLTGIQIQRQDRDEFAINVSSLSASDLQNEFPQTYQYLLDHVKPHRDENSVTAARINWWKFTRPRSEFVPALIGSERYIVTSLTASNRIFVSAPSDTIADSTTVIFAFQDFCFLSLLSSRPHLLWTAHAGGTLEDRPRYNKSVCFDPYPFPFFADNQALASRLAVLGERLNNHYNDRRAEHPKLTLTKIYNVLELLRTDQPIEGKDKEVYDKGLIGILRNIHDEIDKATLEAYGWPSDLPDDDILERLVALNRERALEEARGQIRWLRPEYQNPEGNSGKAKTSDMNLEEVSVANAMSWPKALPEQMAVVREALLSAGQANVEDIRSQFKHAQTKTIKERLDTLAVLGQADILEDGRYAA